MDHQRRSVPNHIVEIREQGTPTNKLECFDCCYCCCCCSKKKEKKKSEVVCNEPTRLSSCRELSASISRRSTSYRRPPMINYRDLAIHLLRIREKNKQCIVTNQIVSLPCSKRAVCISICDLPRTLSLLLSSLSFAALFRRLLRSITQITMMRMITKITHTAGTAITRINNEPFKLLDLFEFYYLKE